MPNINGGTVVLNSTDLYDLSESKICYVLVHMSLSRLAMLVGWGADVVLS